MKSIRLIAVLLALASFCLAVAAANVVGKWEGRFIVNEDHLPKNVPPQQMPAFEQALNALHSTRLYLELRADRSWSIKVHTPVATPVPPPFQNATGTWRIEGHTVIMHQATENGKPTKAKQDTRLHIINGGKNLKLTNDRPKRSGSTEVVEGMLFSRASSNTR